MKKIDEIIETASGAIFSAGSGGVLLNGRREFVNSNHSRIDEMIVLENMTKLSNALVQIKSIAETIKKDESV